MTATDFGGETAEPMVGEVTALRSFRLTDDGYLLPLTDAGGHDPWPTETHSAKCNRKREHLSPDPDCTCGFYAYGNRSWVQGYGPYAWSHLVLAAVHCSGRLVAGEKGLRAQKMRLKACYINKAAPREVLERLRSHYPEVEFFTSRKALLAAYPETTLSTYLETSKRARFFKLFTPTLRGALAALVVPLLVLHVASIVVNDWPSFTRFALLMFALLVWGPIFLDGFSLWRFGATPDALAALRRPGQAPWTMKSARRVMAPPLWRFGLIGISIGFIITMGDEPLWPLGWPTIALAGITVSTIVTLWMEGSKIFPVRKRFPLVPRTMAVHDLRAALPPGATLTRESTHRHRHSSGSHTVEMCDMGGYGVSMIHFDIFSDPEDYPHAEGSAPGLVLTARSMAKEVGIPKGLWIAYIASEDATLRILTPGGTVSPPVPLTEIDAILPLPTHSWCAPGVRRSFIAGTLDESISKGPLPLSLLSGYRQGRPSLDDFSDPRIANALKIARHRSEQSAYRNFKQAEALLPEGLEPLAVPTIPQEERGISESPQAANDEVHYAMRTLLDSPADPSSSRGLAFAIGELLDACDSALINDLASIDFLDEDDKPPANADRQMRGAHMLLIGEVAATLGRDLIKMLSYDVSDGRMYAVVLEPKKSGGRDGASMALKVRNESLKSGGDDDVDALKDAGD